MCRNMWKYPLKYAPEHTIQHWKTKKLHTVGGDPSHTLPPSVASLPRRRFSGNLECSLWHLCVPFFSSDKEGTCTLQQVICCQKHRILITFIWLKIKKSLLRYIQVFHALDPSYSQYHANGLMHGTWYSVATVFSRLGKYQISLCVLCTEQLLCRISHCMQCNKSRQMLVLLTFQWTRMHCSMATGQRTEAALQTRSAIMKTTVNSA